jgi:hypothetical protein
VSRMGGEDSIGPGSWRPSLRIDEKDVDLLFGLAVGRRGQVSVLPAGMRPAPPLLRRIARRILRYRPSR